MKLNNYGIRKRLKLTNNNRISLRIMQVWFIFTLAFVSPLLAQSKNDNNSNAKESTNSRSMFNSDIQSKDSESIPTWVNLPEKQLKTRLKAYAFAKVRTSIISKLSFPKEKTHQYTQCPEMFPSMPGDFPCSLLNYESTNSVSSKEEALEYKAGGVISISESDKKVPLIGGIALLIGNTGSIDEKNEDSIIAYYDPNGLISHYRYKNRVVVFNWAEENKEPTLKAMISVELNSDNWVKGGEEIDYTK